MPMSNMGFVFTDKAEFSFLPVKQKSGNSAYQHEYHRVLPYSANRRIVTAAEIIRPREADFSPFSTSDT